MHVLLSCVVEMAEDNSEVTEAAHAKNRKPVGHRANEVQQNLTACLRLVGSLCELVCTGVDEKLMCCAA